MLELYCGCEVLGYVKSVQHEGTDAVDLNAFTREQVRRGEEETEGEDEEKGNIIEREHDKERHEREGRREGRGREREVKEAKVGRNAKRGSKETKDRESSWWKYQTALL